MLINTGIKKGCKNLRDSIKESFGFKIFISFAVSILIVSSVFTLFFAYHQSRIIKEKLTKEGEMLSGLLAFNSRTGVFAENKDLLKDAVQGIMNQKNVLAVTVYNADKKVLLNEQKNSFKDRADAAGIEDRNIVLKPGADRLFENMDNADTIVFVSPVILESSADSEQAVYFGSTRAAQKQRVIGYVRVVLDKSALAQEIESIMFRNFIIAVALLLSGVIIVYAAVRRFTRPLVRLTKAVKSFGMGESVESVHVESSDEVGKLATAFNNMAENLKSRYEENRLLEEQLRHVQKMEAVGTLTGGIAHDFNNILTTIINCGNILHMKMPKDEPLRTYVARILASSDRAANLTQSLLAFSRKQIINPRPVKINEIIKRARNLLTVLTGEELELRTVPSDRDITIMADSGQIEQILMNLVTNARDAMPDGGVITVRTESVELDSEFKKTHGYGEPGRYALVTVADTGAGMEKAVLERVFEPFFTTKGVGKGTGLGLAIVYGIVKQHNGYINAYSEPGEGTTFRIYFPALATEAEEAAPEESAAPAGGTETILFAEDDKNVRDLVKKILEEFGYEVIEAADGDDAIKKFKGNIDRIRFLLLDVVMPAKNGRMVYEEIKKIKPDMRALFLSGYTADIVQQKGVIEEGLNFISKPVAPTELLKRVREILDG